MAASTCIHRMFWRISRAFRVWIVAALGGCVSVPIAHTAPQEYTKTFGEECIQHSECAEGYQCLVGVCIDGFERVDARDK